MNTIIQGVQNAIAYIEENLAEDIAVKSIAERAYLSEYHFQRMFSALCGFTVGEYIRNRRLTLAAQELSADNARIIDVAVKYGYDSADGFARAFTRFHGISPSAAKEKGAELKAFAPLRIRFTLEGGTMTEYRIVEKEAFTIMGRSRMFNVDTSYSEIPAFWQEHYAQGGEEHVKGMFGACMDSDGKNFEYMIADMYFPWNDVPEGYAARVIPAGTWAVFPCRGAMPKALQDVNTRIWSEWVPNCREYKLSGNYSLEVYLTPPQPDPDKNYCEIWVPVERLG
ncbi:MAG: AraC family transcriptional regulator [Oscillospiraceae bacterium]|nr:AraC family transcriptional regulator [Oscillospiraceae bacterium]